MTQEQATIRQAAETVERLATRRPEVAIVLGSGLAGVADELTDAIQIPYGDLRGCPVPSVPGHPGRLAIGWLGGKTVAVFIGRFHYYEGHSLAAVVYPVRLASAIGCKTLILTNAAGGLNPSFVPGDLMVITDHINFPGLAGHNPLAGPDLGFGPCFVDMKDAYAPDLVELTRSAASAVGVELREGAYAMVAGPSYETPAEVRMLRVLGADAVGMSTAPEVLAARQLGMRVLAISCITNVAAGLGTGSSVNHQEVMERGRTAGPRLAALLREVVVRLDR